MARRSRHGGGVCGGARWVRRANAELQSGDEEQAVGEEDGDEVIEIRADEVWAREVWMQDENCIRRRRLCDSCGTKNRGALEYGMGEF